MSFIINGVHSRPLLLCSQLDASEAFNPHLVTHSPSSRGWDWEWRIELLLVNNRLPRCLSNESKTIRFVVPSTWIRPFLVSFASCSCKSSMSSQVVVPLQTLFVLEYFLRLVPVHWRMLWRYESNDTYAEFNILHQSLIIIIIIKCSHVHWLCQIIMGVGEVI